MLSRIKEERLPVIAAPVDSRAFSDELNSARSHVLDLISRHLTEFGNKFPAETCQNGFYPLTDNVEWTTSFWTGQLWLAWEMSGEEKFRAMAEKHVRSFGLRIAGRNDTNTHDLGFLYTLSCVAAWRLTGNREARGFSLLAAEALLERFHEKAKIIRAWGDLSDPDRGRANDHRLQHEPAAALLGNGADGRSALCRRRKSARHAGGDVPHS